MTRHACHQLWSFAWLTTGQPLLYFNKLLLLRKAASFARNSPLNVVKFLHSMLHLQGDMSCGHRHRGRLHDPLPVLGTRKFSTRTVQACSRTISAGMRTAEQLYELKTHWNCIDGISSSIG